MATAVEQITGSRPRLKADSPISRAPRVGAIAGAIAIYLAMVGIVERFNTRAIVAEVINMGPLLIYLVFLVAGYLAARPAAVRFGEEEPPPPPLGAGLAGGATGGAVAGAMVGLLMIIGNLWDLRRMFVAVGPGLINILSFGQDAVPGALLITLFAAVLGLIGGALHLLSADNRKPFFVGAAVMLLFSLAQPLLLQIFRETNLPSDWLYVRGGMTVMGAIIVFAFAFGIKIAATRQDKGVRERVGELPEKQQSIVKLVTFGVILAILVVLPNILGPFLSEVIGTVGLFVLLGLGLNIVIGYAGLLDLGYVAFFAVGAYATALLTSPAAFTGGPFGFWVALPLVVIIATICGILIGAPVLRLRGDYLAIVTLGFGEIVRIVVLSDWAKAKTGGAQGILRIPSPSIFGYDFNRPQRLYYLILVFCIGAVFLSARMQDSRIGRAWAALREDEQVAEAMGISIIKTKLMAFSMGAAVASFGGMFFAVKIGSVFPHSMNLLVSIQVLALIVLGGMGSIPGVIVGAFVLVGLPELLREFVEYRLHIYGAVLVALMLVKPEGLVPSVRRQRELHEEELDDAQWDKRHGGGEGEGAPVIVAGQPKDIGE
jgi:branched-chain amino acid transport system permease protein